MNFKDLPVDPRREDYDLECACGSKNLIPDKDVMDTWGKLSSLTPLIPTHWLENNSNSDQIIPMSLRPQSHDIIRTWAFLYYIKILFTFR